MRNLEPATVPVYRNQAHYKREYSGSGWVARVPEDTRCESSLGAMSTTVVGQRIEQLWSEKCLYCRTPLEIASTQFSRGDTSGNGRILDGIWWVTHDRLEQKVCSNCGWWCKLDHLSRNTAHEDDVIETEIATEGVLEVFQIDDKRLPLEALRLYLRSHPERTVSLDSRVFERLVGDIYRDFYHCEVRHLGGAGDNGIDLVAIISDEPVIIQVKRTASGTLKSGPEIVRALLGASLLARVGRAQLVTSAARFSPLTIETARRAELQSPWRVKIDLKALGELLSMLRIANDSSDFVRRLAGGHGE